MPRGTLKSLVSSELVCGCRPGRGKKPLHVAVALRAAALNAMPVLWDAVNDGFSAGSCALRYQTGRVLALVRVGSGIDGPDSDMRTRLEGWHRGISIRVGTVSGGRSSTHAGHLGVRQALAEAERALMLGERLRGPGFLTVYGDVFALDYVGRLIEDDRLADVYEQVVSRLLAFDHTEGAELIPTLEEYFASGCSMQGTATAMGIHRNTVLYRLKRIEELSGVRLADGEVRFFIQLAIRAHRYLAS